MKFSSFSGSTPTKMKLKARDVHIKCSTEHRTVRPNRLNIGLNMFGRRPLNNSYQDFSNILWLDTAGYHCICYQLQKYTWTGFGYRSIRNFLKKWFTIRTLITFSKSDLNHFTDNFPMILHCFLIVVMTKGIKNW